MTRGKESAGFRRFFVFGASDFPKIGKVEETFHARFALLKIGQGF
jgi:hypothetical protein